MKRKIIVPIDFSPCSLHAAGYASSLAKVFHADIELFNICHPHPEAAVSGTGNWPYSEDGGQQTHELYMLESLASSLSQSLTSLDVEGEFLPAVSISFSQGDLCKETISRTGTAEFALTVMGLSRKKGFFSVKLGPDVLQLVRSSTIPVICVPEQYSFSLPKKLAFATNLDLLDIPLLKAFVSFSQALNADILILHANLGKTTKSPKIGFSDFLTKAAKEMDFSRVSHRSIISRQLTPALQYAINGGDIEMLAMTCHKKGGFNRLLGRHHILHLLQRTPIPLLFYHSL